VFILRFLLCIHQVSAGPSSEGLNLTKIVHALDQNHSGPNLREAFYHRDALSMRFPSEQAQEKFILVLNALVTACTATAGQDNISVMISLSETISIFVCRNGGPPLKGI
jgi:hypothetical protein